MAGISKAAKGVTDFLSELAARGGNALKNYEVWNKGNKAVYNSHVGDPSLEGMPRTFYRGLRKDDFNKNAWPNQVLDVQPGLDDAEDDILARMLMSPSERIKDLRAREYPIGGTWFGTNDDYARSYALKTHQIARGDFDHLPDVRYMRERYTDEDGFFDMAGAIGEMRYLSHQYPELVGPIYKVALQQRRPLVVNAEGLPWHNLEDAELILPERFYDKSDFIPENYKSVFDKQYGFKKKSGRLSHITMFPDEFLSSARGSDMFGDFLRHKQQLFEKQKDALGEFPHASLWPKITMRDMTYAFEQVGKEGGTVRDALANLKTVYDDLADYQLRHGITEKTGRREHFKLQGDDDSVYRNYAHHGDTPNSFIGILGDGMPVMRIGRDDYINAVDDIKPQTAKFILDKYHPLETNDLADMVAANPRLADSLTMEMIQHRINPPSSEHVIIRGPQAKMFDSNFNYRSPYMNRIILGGLGLEGLSDIMSDLDRAAEEYSDAVAR